MPKRIMILVKTHIVDDIVVFTVDYKGLRTTFDKKKM